MERGAGAGAGAVVGGLGFPGHVPPVEYEINYYLATKKPQATAIN
ncbi:hypothetical protein [Streptomyces sp. NPDC059122]